MPPKHTNSSTVVSTLRSTPSIPSTTPTLPRQPIVPDIFSPSALYNNASLSQNSTNAMPTDGQDQQTVKRQQSMTNAPSLRFVPHIDPRSARPSLSFSPITRILPDQDAIIRVGRYSEKDSQSMQSPNFPSASPVGFKSKVVSRRHCQFWFSNNQWHIRDNASSSGTFLNHVRLSAPGVESRAFPVNDGDLVQLGIDFRGGEEMIFRCVKLRLELNRDWQKGLNNFK
jgi:hypothetical protein